MNMGMENQEKIELFKEINGALPTDKGFVFDLFSSFLPLANDPFSFQKGISHSYSILFRSDYILSQLNFDEDFDPETDNDLLGSYKHRSSVSDIDTEIKAIESFFQLLKSKNIIEISSSIKKMKTDDIEAEDHIDYERRDLIISGRVSSYVISITFNKNNAYLLEEFANTFIIGRYAGEKCSDKRQNELTAKYILKKQSEFDKEDIVLNLSVFYGLQSLPSFSVDDREYLDQKTFQKIDLVKRLMELSSLGYFSIKSSIYAINTSSKILPHTIAISITPEQVRKLERDFIKKATEKKIVPVREEKNELVYFPDAGKAGYKNATASFKYGTKSHALLTLLNNNKETGFNVDEIKKHCNRLIGKDAAKFRAEKDINDTIREIKTKLGIKKSEYFPIQSRIIREEKQWIWAEK